MLIKFAVFIRNLCLMITGLTCLLFATLTLINGSPSPLSSLTPPIVGMIAFIMIYFTYLFGGAKVSQIIWDELSKHEWARAVKFGYWFAVLLYPIFTFLILNKVVAYPQALASMAALTGGIPLLYFCFINWRQG